MVQKKWNAETIVSALKALHAQGTKINVHYIQSANSGLYHAGIRLYGSWRAVLVAADLLHAVSQRKRWSKQIIIAMIEEMIEKKEPLNNGYVKNNHRSLYTSSCHYFGSWKEAIEAVGVDYDAIRLTVRRTWSKETIVKEILRRRDAGLTLSGMLIQKEDVGLYEAAMLHFGKHGWAEAREAAGLPRRDPRPGIIYDKQIVIDSLRKLHDEGHDINVSAFIGSPHANLMTAGIRLFGSHDKALTAAGFNPEKIRKQRRWTKAKVLREIRALEKARVRLNWWTIGQTHNALCSTAVRLYGTWGQAVEAAGINYRKHLRQWSSKTFLRQLSQGEYEKTITSRITRKRKSRKN